MASPSDIAPSRILLVDDEPLILRAYAAMLATRAYDVHTAASGAEALEQLRAQSFDVIISDIAMPGLDGLALLRQIRELDLDVPVILMTGGPSVESAALAVEQGAFRYLSKPVRMKELCDAVAKASQLHQLATLKRQALELMGRTHRQLGDRAGLEVRMHAALSNLVMLFQPIVNWSERRVIAYEALVRSREPTLPNAQALLSAAERLGCTRDLGRAIRREVASAARRLPPGVRLFLNLHANDLADEDLFDPHAPLTEHAQHVTLEITERASLEAVPDIRERIMWLRSLGFAIAVDDLGAGYAGLTSLAQLEPDLVKLDMSLVRGIDTNPTQQILVRSMAALCGEMGMGFVVEGVETLAELETVAGLGADQLQGFLFGRPGPGFAPVSWPDVAAGDPARQASTGS
jgi:EAL domain-containing protein (putative c-di-GMP-specific phosphodiesterase class I)